MAKKKSVMRRVVKTLASLKIAVFVILGIAVVSAWGTIVESMYGDAKRAQEVVYHSWYAYLIFFILIVNLTAVIFDRYPWKKGHEGFISAHVGIIILLIGSLMTRYYGVDGSMAINIGESKSRVTVGETHLVVYSGMASGRSRLVYEQPVQFIKSPPSPENPYTIEFGADKIVVDDFRPYSIPQMQVTESAETSDGPGLRFQIANERVKESDWLLIGSRPYEVKEMGPAKIVLSRSGAYKYEGGNVLLLETQKQDNKPLLYSVFTASKNGLVKKGRAVAGDAIETGWMGLTFRILKKMDRAKVVWNYEPLQRATEETIQSIRFNYNGQEYWAGLNAPVRLFSDSAFHVFAYGNRQLKLDFAIRLDQFNVGRYQGTQRAASYESDVTVMDPAGAEAKVKISMNEPLKYKGFTFYQSSFKEDESGRPTMSILSVNYDPGRWPKYFGCLLIVFGIIHLFYFKGRKARS